MYLAACEDQPTAVASDGSLRPVASQAPPMSGLRARGAFETVRRQFPREETLGRYAAEQLAMLDTQAGLLERLRKRLGIR